MVKIIGDEQQVWETSPIPKLELLRLYHLPKLQTFSELRYDLEFPSLKGVWITFCPLLESFSLGSLSTPKLESLSIDQETITNKEDLNGVLHERFRAKESTSLEEEEGEDMTAIQDKVVELRGVIFEDKARQAGEVD
ncbi:hypothetical protein Pfo_000980 [Paulownia fortunei]|nr:hypothetical protein Pfo_000980 [Paulownia fortunei]